MTDNDLCSLQADRSETQGSDLTTGSQIDESETISALLSQKQRRAALKRERRRRKRQALAKLRETDQSQNDEDNAGDEEEEKAKEQRELLQQEWMERERIAQEEFRLKTEREEAARIRKEEEEKRIREEWEEQERKEQEEREQKEQEKKDREEAVQKMLDQAEIQLENGGQWKNPDAPKDYGTEKDKANCPFFLKTGACRFGERCSRKHEHPSSSTTLMVKGMFVTFGMVQIGRDDYDTDASLEYSEEDVHQQFLDFYEDVLPEFKNAGKVVQFKVSCNFEPHLRGNVYVQYDTEEQCKEAFMMFNGRWYAGKQLQCEFSPVTRWKTAICGLYDRRKCPKGKHCNFLHVFRNPGNDFWEADRDLHMSPERGGSFSSRHFGGRDGMWSQRGNSPDRSQRRRTDRRSRSRERNSYRGRRSRSGERRSRSRGRKNRNKERRSRSRTRERGPSQQSLIKGQRSQREQSRRSRSRSRSKDQEENSRKKRSKSDSPEHVSKNGSVKKSRHSRKSKSPEDSDTTEKASHHHRHSKKSKKKKSKKKHRKKKSKSHSPSSSAGSNEESGNEGCDATPKSEVCTEEAPFGEAASACTPDNTAEIQVLERCQEEEEIRVVLTDSTSETTTYSEDRLCKT
nr:U2 small nuclear ribonucleoprotein auxiliary factor 35 kDa subunit-related protein 2 isoform X2 [Misgurnus anguillicaudatus]